MVQKAWKACRAYNCRYRGRSPSLCFIIAGKVLIKMAMRNTLSEFKAQMAKQFRLKLRKPILLFFTLTTGAILGFIFP